ncbi:uncharacterized protein [Ptychodera flava]|uniref:uncharacterized protein isoform X5 n=1 Tax=Ptychodera flava TaxID=63121 RepID=UPI003969C20D
MLFSLMEKISFIVSKTISYNTDTGSETDQKRVAIEELEDSNRNIKSLCRYVHNTNIKPNIDSKESPLKSIRLTPKAFASTASSPKSQPLSASELYGRSTSKVGTNFAFIQSSSSVSITATPSSTTQTSAAKSLKMFIHETVTTIDKDIKAVGYDVYREQKQSALETLEKVRRKIKALDKKSEVLLSKIENELGNLNETVKSLKVREQSMMIEKENLLTEKDSLASQLKNVFDESDFLEEFTTDVCAAQIVDEHTSQL